MRLCCNTPSFTSCQRPIDTIYEYYANGIRIQISAGCSYHYLKPMPGTTMKIWWHYQSAKQTEISLRAGSLNLLFLDSIDGLVIISRLGNKTHCCSNIAIRGSTKQRIPSASSCHPYYPRRQYLRYTMFIAHPYD